MWLDVGDNSLFNQEIGRPVWRGAGNRDLRRSILFESVSKDFIFRSYGKLKSKKSQNHQHYCSAPNSVEITHCDDSRESNEAILLPGWVRGYILSVATRFAAI